MAVGMRANTAHAELDCGAAPFLFFTISYGLLFILLALLFLDKAEMAARE